MNFKIFQKKIFQIKKLYFYSKSLKAFTLIELIIVIAIIGILSTIVYTPITSSLRKGRDVKKISELKSIQNALFNYYDSYGEYPKTLQDLSASSSFKLPKDIAPISVNSTIFPDKYNYTVYSLINSKGEKRKGFHLYTNLESVNEVLDSSAKCRGVFNGNVYNKNYCLLNTYSSSFKCYTNGDGGAGDCSNDAKDSKKTLNILESERVNKDTENNCKQDKNSCIFDLTHNS